MTLYDDNAFFYFLLSICTLYLLPGTYYAFSRILFFLLGSRKHLQARTTVERNKIKETTEQSYQR